jgi:hypothetical protein
MNKEQEIITNAVNAALKNFVVPTVGVQKQEYYKAGARDLVKLIQAEIDKL